MMVSWFYPILMSFFMSLLVSLVLFGLSFLFSSKSFTYILNSLSRWRYYMNVDNVVENVVKNDMDVEKKVQAIREWEPPTKVSE